MHPADAVLSLPRGRHSHGLARLAVSEAIRVSYDAAHEAIARRCGPVLGKRQLAGLLVGAARDVDAFYGQRVAQPCTSDTVLVRSVDGKGITRRPEALRKATRQAAGKQAHTFRTRLAAGEKSGRKRMATLGAVYDAEPAARRPHGVIAPPGGGQYIPRPGPTAQAKWLCASVVHDAGHVVHQVFDTAQARDQEHRRCWVVLVDGARHQLDLVQAEARMCNVKVPIVIDVVHVLEYSWGAAFSFPIAGEAAAEDWVAAHALALLAGDVDGVIKAIQFQGNQVGLSTEQRHGADKCIRYLRTEREFLHYEKALASGGPSRQGSSRERHATSSPTDSM